MSTLPPLVLLSAGRSSRMGTPKGLLRVPVAAGAGASADGGEPWLLAQLRAFRAAGGTRAVVVLGFDRDRYQAELPPGWQAELGAEVVVNPAPERGKFSSLQCGLLAISGAAFVLPVDVPAPPPAVWQLLAGDAQTNSRIDVTIPTHEGRGGHPVFLSAEFVRALLVAPAESRLDERIRALAQDRVARIEAGYAGVLSNLNTPEDVVQAYCLRASATQVPPPS